MDIQKLRDGIAAAELTLRAEGTLPNEIAALPENARKSVETTRLWFASLTQSAKGHAGRLDATRLNSDLSESGRTRAYAAELASYSPDVDALHVSIDKDAANVAATRDGIEAGRITANEKGERVDVNDTPSSVVEAVTRELRDRETRDRLRALDTVARRRVLLEHIDDRNLHRAAENATVFDPIITPELRREIGARRFAVSPLRPMVEAHERAIQIRRMFAAKADGLRLS
jgi:hypothetical protein